MINPKWLSGAYIVENTALDYDADDSFGLSSKPTNIKITKYRDFVSHYPQRSSYFQPVVEKLEYVTPEIVGSAPYVLIEGSSDYYALRAVAEVHSLTLPFRLVPGTGSGACGPLISLLLGRGERFIVLLDGDRAGKKEAQRYKDAWFLADDAVLTVGELDAEFSGLSLEGFLDAESVEIIRQNGGYSSMPSKKQIGWYFAEICAAGGSEFSLSPSSLAKFLKILRLLETRFLKSESV